MPGAILSGLITELLFASGQAVAAARYPQACQTLTESCSASAFLADGGLCVQPLPISQGPAVSQIRALLGLCPPGRWTQVEPENQARSCGHMAQPPAAPASH